MDLTPFFFEPLPALCEGDERLSLRNLLSLREGCLSEEELWAVCRESCMILKDVCNSPDVFQALCITPDVMAFDSNGGLCFLYNSKEPDEQFLAPEYDAVGSSFKGHMYSLGMTLNFAAHYNMALNRSLPLSDDIMSTMSKMTSEDYQTRTTMEYVLLKCAENLLDRLAADICLDLVKSVGHESSLQGGSPVSFCSTPPFLAVSATAAGGCTAQIPGKISPVVDTLLRVSLPDPLDLNLVDAPAEFNDNTRAFDPHCLDTRGGSPINEALAGTDQGLVVRQISDISRTAEVPRITCSENSEGSLWSAPDKILDQVSKQSLGTESDPREHAQVQLVDSSPLAPDRPARSERPPDLKPFRLVDSSSTPPCKEQKAFDRSGDPVRYTTHSDKTFDKLQTDSNEYIASEVAAGRSKISESVVLGVKNLRDVVNICLNEKSTTENDIKIKPSLKEKFTLDVDKLTPPISDKSSTSATEELRATACCKKEHVPGEDFKATPNCIEISARNDLQITRAETQISRDEELAKIKDTSSGSQGQNPLSKLLASKDIQDFAPDVNEEDMSTTDEELVSFQRNSETWDDHNESLTLDTSSYVTMETKSRQCSLHMVCQNLGCGLHEDELWAVCCQCVNALQDSIVDIPAYISPDSMLLDTSGMVTFKDPSSLGPLKSVYMAPELQQRGLPTEKTCVYGVAASLWSAADYNIPKNEEPDLSPAMEHLLLSMTQENPDVRPTLSQILEDCNENADVSGTRTVCSQLVEDALDAADFGRDNELVKGSLLEQTEHRAAAIKAKVVDVIRGSELRQNLKPAHERQLASPRYEDCLHDILMKQIKSRAHRLRKTSRPKVMGVEEIFYNNRDAISHLSHVTKQTAVVTSTPIMHESYDTRNRTQASSHYKILAHKLQELKQKKLQSEATGRPEKNEVAEGQTESERQDSMRRNCDVSEEVKSETSVWSCDADPPPPKSPLTLPSNIVVSMQVELQHDAHTGLYNLIPVALPSNFSLMSPASSSDQSSVRLHSYSENSEDGTSKSVYGQGLSLPPEQLRSLVETSEGRQLQSQGASVRRTKSMEWQQGFYTDGSTGHHTVHQTRPLSQHAHGHQVRRARSGSNLHYIQRATDIQAYEVYDDSKPQSLRCTNLSKSQPNLGRSMEEWCGKDKHRGHRRCDVYSPSDVTPSTSPSLSRDSGVGGPRTDSLRHKTVKKLLRDEFAFEGYMENGVEEFQMAEYICGLTGLSWTTFCSAITEKFVDLFWSDELLSNLYESANGRKQRLEATVDMQVDDKETVKTYHHASLLQESSSRNPQSRDCYDDSAFRPISTANTSRGLDTVQSVFRPKPHRLSSSSDADHFSSADIQRSSSLHNIQLTNNVSETSQITVKALSHGDLSKSSHIQVTNQETKLDQECERIPVIYLSGQSSESHAKLTKQTPSLCPAKNPHGRTETPSKYTTPSSSTRGHYPDRTESGQSNNTPSEHSYQTDSVSRGISPQDSIFNESTRYGGMIESNFGNRESPAASSVSDWPGQHAAESWPGRDEDVWDENDERLYYHPDLLDKYNDCDEDDDDIPREWMQNRSQNGDISPEYDRDLYSSHSDHRPDGKLGFIQAESSSASSSSSKTVSARSSADGMSSGETKTNKQKRDEVACSSTDDVAPDVVADSQWQRLLGSDIAYYWSEATINTTPYILAMVAKMDTSNQEEIEARICEVEQERFVEERNKRRTFRYFRKLQDATKANKGSSEQKSQRSRVMQQLAEIKEKLDRLLAARRHLELVYADMWGMSLNLLASLAASSADQPMLLCPSPYSSILYLHSASEGATGSELLHAGTPTGLMSYLFVKNAFAKGYIHEFFFCFRYVTSPAELLTFITDKVTASTLSLTPDSGAPSKVKARGLDLLQVWIEGYYSIDFAANKTLIESLASFLRKMADSDAFSSSLLETLSTCEKGERRDFSLKPRTDVIRSEISLDENKLMKELELEHEWESFKLSMKLGPHKSATSVPLHQTAGTACLQNVSVDQYGADDYHPKGGALRSDDFSMADYTACSLAEQLTLIQEALFQQSHPVHYLNSRARGISVQLTLPVLSRTQSLAMINTAQESNSGCSNLFVEADLHDNVLHNLVEIAHSIALWVPSEILSCASAKMQMSVIIKFINTAKHCKLLRNYATCVSIVDGLENLLVRQLPIWKSIPSKSVLTMEELSQFKQNLKSDAMFYKKEIHWGSVPTIPCILYFLLHVQQLEVGSFTLVNGMFKWNKMRTITELVDQIRICRQRTYRFMPDTQMQSSIKERINELSQTDLQMLASQNINNFPKMPSSSGLGRTFRRLRNRLQRKNVTKT